MNNLCKVLLQLCSQMLQMVGTTPFLWQYIFEVFQFCTFSGELNPLLTYAVIFFFIIHSFGYYVSDQNIISSTVQK